MSATLPANVRFDTIVDTVEIDGAGWVRFLFQCGSLTCMFVLPPVMAVQFARELVNSVADIVRDIADEDQRRKENQKLIVPDATS